MQPIRAFAAWIAPAVWILTGAAAFAAAQSGALAGYTSHVWNASDGLPEQTVQAFAQTPDGYLWIGTTGGLVRFDGAHFAVFDRQNTPALHENSVFTLKVSRDGGLWIGTEGGGLARLSHGQFRSWLTRDGLSNDFVRTIAEDAAGRIWVGTDNGLLRLDGDRFKRIDGTAEVPTLAVHFIYSDRTGNLWVGGSRLFCLKGDSATEYRIRWEASQNRVKSIVQTQGWNHLGGHSVGVEQDGSWPEKLRASKRNLWNCSRIAPGCRRSAMDRDHRARSLRVQSRKINADCRANFACPAIRC